MIELTDKPIDTQRVLSSVNHPECGAEVLFVGTTRQWTQPAAASLGPQADSSAASPPAAALETSHLVYEAYHDMALAQLQRLENEARRRWPLREVTIVHRLGRVEPTEASVAVAVSCPHRSEAFEAAKWLIDELKHQVPIWKQEHYVQRGAEWIHPTAGNCRCSPVVDPATSDNIAANNIASDNTPFDNTSEDTVTAKSVSPLSPAPQAQSHE